MLEQSAPMCLSTKDHTVARIGVNHLITAPDIDRLR